MPPPPHSKTSERLLGSAHVKEDIAKRAEDVQAALDTQVRRAFDTIQRFNLRHS